MPRINLTIRLGPMVHFEMQGESCKELVAALDGFDQLNSMVDSMFSDLAQRVYPEGDGRPEGAGPDAGSDRETAA
jgi:hypothetical protein